MAECLLLSCGSKHGIVVHCEHDNESSGFIKGKEFLE
jgi:hypothetical protein